MIFKIDSSFVGIKKHMKKILITMLAFTLGASAQEKKNKNAKYDVEVNGNCEQCKARIEKAAFSVKGVKSAEWHPDDHVLHLIINEEKTSLGEVEKAIANAGHDNPGAQATDADYKHLPACCHYDRK